MTQDFAGSEKAIKGVTDMRDSGPAIASTYLTLAQKSYEGGAAVQVQAVEADPMLACSLPERSAGAVAIQRPHGRRPLSAGW